MSTDNEGGHVIFHIIYSSCLLPLGGICYLTSLYYMLWLQRFDLMRYHCQTGLYAGPNDCQSHVLVDTWMLTVKPIYKL